MRFLKIAVAANGAGSGKDFLAHGLKKSDDIDRLAFADPIKTMTAIATGLTADDVNAIKEGRIAPFIRERLSPDLQDLPTEELQRRMRRVLQLIGTDVFRHNWSERAWVHKALKTVASMEQRHVAWHETRPSSVQRPPRGIVLTDVRFPNEFDALQQAGFFMVDLDAPEEYKHIKPGTPEHEHPSERALDAYRAERRFDHSLWNDRTLTAWDLARDVVSAEAAWHATEAP